eukprot:2714517-Amphidinium_carterae.1
MLTRTVDKLRSFFERLPQEHSGCMGRRHPRAAPAHPSSAAAANVILKSGFAQGLASSQRTKGSSGGRPKNWLLADLCHSATVPLCLWPPHGVRKVNPLRSERRAGLSAGAR